MNYILELLMALNGCKVTGLDNIPSSLLRPSLYVALSSNLIYRI